VYFRSEGFDHAEPVFALAAGADSPMNNVQAGGGTGTLATPTFADADGDGDLDLIAGSAEGTISFYRRRIKTEYVAHADKLCASAYTVDMSAFTIEQGYAMCNSEPLCAGFQTDGGVLWYAGASNCYASTGHTVYKKVEVSGVAAFDFVDGSGGPTPFTSTSLGAGTNVAPAFADVDEDGQEDMVFGSSGGTISMYDNNQNSPTAAEDLLIEIYQDWRFVGAGSCQDVNGASPAASVYTDRADAAACRALCESTAGCLGIRWRSSQTECWLYGGAFADHGNGVTHFSGTSLHPQRFSAVTGEECWDYDPHTPLVKYGSAGLFHTNEWTHLVLVWSDEGSRGHFLGVTADGVALSPTASNGWYGGFAGEANDGCGRAERTAPDATQRLTPAMHDTPVHQLRARIGESQVRIRWG
jgi:hypothetical protein